MAAQAIVETRSGRNRGRLGFVYLNDAASALELDPDGAERRVRDSIL